MIEYLDEMEIHLRLRQDIAVKCAEHDFPEPDEVEIVTGTPAAQRVPPGHYAKDALGIWREVSK